MVCGPSGPVIWTVPPGTGIIAKETVVPGMRWTYAVSWIAAP
jgi:hypothetical protein